MYQPGWRRQTIPPKPHGWIQWKGTELCIDIHCDCGYTEHIDSDFVYYIQCPQCKNYFMLNGHIELVQLTQEEANDPSFKNIPVVTP